MPREASLSDEVLSMLTDDDSFADPLTPQSTPTVTLVNPHELDVITSVPTRTRLKREKLELPQIAPRGRILIVDEDVAFCGTLHKMLERAHDVLAVSSGSHALANIQAGTRHDIILCGLTTPTEFHEALLSRWPQQADAVIFLTPPFASPSSRLKNPSLAKPLELTRLQQLITNRLVSPHSY